MKKAIRITNTLLVCSVACVLLACTKKKPIESTTEEHLQTKPSTEIPVELTQGYWLRGSVSALHVYDPKSNRDLGNYVSNAQEYQFFNLPGSNGVKSKFLYHSLIVGRGGCITEVYTATEGTVEFIGNNKIILHATKSRVTVTNTGSCSNPSYVREVPKNELSSTTYLCGLLQEEGETYLYLFNETDLQMQSPVFVFRNYK